MATRIQSTPINPGAEEILGYKCYPNIKDVPYVIDAAVITVPAKFVPEVVRDAGEKESRA